MNRLWTQLEINDAHRLSADEFLKQYPDRTPDALRIKRGRTLPSYTDQAPDFTSDKKIGELDWREINTLVKTMQYVKNQASFSQDTATIKIDSDNPVCVVGLSDTHILSWGTDHGLFQEVTDELLATPNLYVALLGDLQQMSIKMRGVLEMSDNMLPPELQHRYLESWLAEIGHKVLWATWDNHSAMREEDASGCSRYADILKRNVVYHNGIGHPDVYVGNQRYKFAATHMFPSRSRYHPCHGGVTYLLNAGHTREIAMSGDSHVPGIEWFTHGEVEKLAINAGSLQMNSGYAKRFFTLHTHPKFPAVVLFPDEHRFEPISSIKAWNRLYQTS